MPNEPDPKNWMRLFTLADERQVLASNSENSDGDPALCLQWLTRDGVRMDVCFGFDADVLAEKFASIGEGDIISAVYRIEGGA